MFFKRDVLQTMALRILKSSKAYYISAALSIILTSLLFASIFTVVMGTGNAIQQATLRQVGGDGHAILKYIDDAAYEKLKMHSSVREISYGKLAADDILNEELKERRGEIWYLDDVAIRMNFVEPTVGRPPIYPDEIIADTTTLKLLGVKDEIGEIINLTLNVKGIVIQKEFTLSGYWESDPAMKASRFIVSSAYAANNEDLLGNHFPETPFLSGAITSSVFFNNDKDIRRSLDMLLVESGYQSSEPAAENYIESNVNWAYFTAYSIDDPITLVICVLFAALVGICGSLIIYNIFHIAMIHQIRLFGRLRLIGATRIQIKKLIIMQAAFLLITGIPIGAAFGFFVGKAFVPLIIEQSAYKGMSVDVPMNLWIFVGSAILSIITVGAGIIKPINIASKAAPVQSVNFLDMNVKAIPGRQVKHGSKVVKMAIASFLQNKKNTILAVASLSLCFIILNCFYSIYMGFDIDKYLSKFVDTDFLVANNEYFRFDYMGRGDTLSHELIDSIQAQPAYQDGGAIYFSNYEEFTVESDRLIDYRDEYNLNHDAHIYGMESFNYDRLEVIEGSLYTEGIPLSQCIVEGIRLDDFNTPLLDKSPFKLGDMVGIQKNVRDETGKIVNTYMNYFTIIGKIAMGNSINSGYSSTYFNFYLPIEAYAPIVSEQAIMSFAFDAEQDKTAEMEAFMSELAENEPMMAYRSKKTETEAFSDIKDLVEKMGVVMCAAIGLIGMLNYANVTIMGIIAREKTFILLRIAGATRVQIRRMLYIEGLQYALAVLVISLCASTVISCIFIQRLENIFWFFQYHFSLNAIIYCLPFWIIISALTPVCIFKLRYPMKTLNQNAASYARGA
ncbi:MAG: ABC transporter permease [Clostridiales Family XIII bacterium]|jgi:putative ABC transport system permease protein|nr:ABC transporter permease [Clostridiales Family XIII bacterium]